MPNVPLPERTDADRLGESRLLSESNLIKAGAELRDGFFFVPESVQNRIRKIGGLVHAKLESDQSSELMEAFRRWTESRFSGRGIKSLTRQEFVELTEKLRSLGAADLRRFERRVAQLSGRSGMLDYATWGELHNGAEAAIKLGLEYRKGEAAVRFEKDDYLSDKRLD